MHPLLEQTDHRPWPVPNSGWVMEQTWRDLLFANWSYPADEVRAVVPEQLQLDLFEGKAWIGVVPFVLENLRFRGLPPRLPPDSFEELNVRTYVTVDGKPGVYFFSLDAASRVAVFGARTLYHLNYLNAEMSLTRTATGIEYTSERTDTRGGPASFRASYAASGAVMAVSPGSLDYFLTERYCFYSVSAAKRVYRGEIHHRPWRLQPAEAELNARSMLVAAGLPAPRGLPLLHFSHLQPIIAWPPERVGRFEAHGS